MKMSDSNNEVQKLAHLNSLRILGKPNIRETLISWLADPAFKRKGDIIDEKVRLKDSSLIPEIERYVHADDERIAVRARENPASTRSISANEPFAELKTNNENSTVIPDCLNTA